MNNQNVMSRRLNDVRVAFADFIEPTIDVFRAIKLIIAKGIQAVIRK